MGAVWFRFRAELRTRWRTWTVLALLIGVASGVVIAAAAGARRTDSAYERFLHEQRAFDVVVIPLCEGFDNAETPPECSKVSALAGLDVVSASVPVSSISGADVRTADGRSLDESGANGNFVEVSLLGSTDGGFGRTLNRMHVLDGRVPRADAANEVALSAPLAARAGVEVGDTLRARLDRYPSGRVTYALRVVGIEVSPYEVAPPSGAYNLVVHLSPEFVRRAPARGLRVETGLALRLHGGDESVGAVLRAVEARRIDAFVLRQSDQAAGIERAIRPDTVGLTLLAVLSALALVAVFGAALARQAWAESSDHATLWSLGVRRRQLVAMTIIRAAFIGLVAMATAVVAAFFLSALTPIGLARDLEPAPGLHADALTLGVGAVLTVVLTLALVAAPAWLIARAAGSGVRRRSPLRPSRVAATVSQVGGSIPATIGVRMAVERDRGRGAVPVRTGVLGVAVGVVVLCAALGFSASLHHLLESPRLIGYTWDAIVFVGDENSVDVDADADLDADAVSAEIESIPGVAATTPGEFAFGSFFTDRPLLLGPHRRAVDLLVIGPGRVRPAVIDGRAPIGADEILLGPDTLDEVGLEVGDTVNAFGQVGPDIREEGDEFIVLNEPDVGKETSARFRIVGTGVTPPFVGDPRTETRLGRGAVMTVAGLQRLNPIARPRALYVRFTDRADHSSVLAALRREERAGGIAGLFSGRVSTEEYLEVEQIDEFPLVLAGLVAFVAACVLAHLLASSVRARRRDLAVLRALGFRRRQVRSVIAWQASTIATVALVVGVPAGVVLGRWGWQLYAGTINVVPEPAVSLVALVVTVVGAILVANVVGLLPARSAARLRPAVALRSE